MTDLQVREARGTKKDSLKAVFSYLLYMVDGVWGIGNGEWKAGVGGWTRGQITMDNGCWILDVGFWMLEVQNNCSALYLLNGIYQNNGDVKYVLIAEPGQIYRYVKPKETKKDRPKAVFSYLLYSNN